MSISYIIKDDSINLVLNNKPFTVDSNHPNFSAVKEAIKSGQSEDQIENLASIKKAISASTGGLITIKGNSIYYRAKKLHNVITNRILNLLNEGFNVLPMLNFLENLHQNPSRRSVEQIFSFLEHKSLSITEDGHFLAYKAVDSEFWSKTAGEQIPLVGKTKSNGMGKFYIYNAPGEIVEVERNEVDDDPKSHCSYGLHVGAIEYVRSFGNSNDKYVIVKVNPRDTVSVPEDEQCQKNRVCRYEVLSEMDRSFVLEKECYQSDGTEFDPNKVEEVEEDGKTKSDGYKKGFARGRDAALNGDSNDLPDHWSDDFTTGFLNGYDEYENLVDEIDSDENLFADDVDDSFRGTGGYVLGQKRARLEFSQSKYQDVKHYWSEEYQSGYKYEFSKLFNDGKCSTDCGCHEEDEYPSF